MICPLSDLVSANFYPMKTTGTGNYGVTAGDLINNFSCTAWDGT